MFFFVVRNLYWQPWSLCYQLPKPCWESRLSPAGSTGKKWCVPVEEKSKASGETWQARPVGVLQVRWQNLDLVKLYHSKGINAIGTERMLSGLVPKSTGLWLSSSVIFGPLSQSYKNWDPKAVEAKKDHPHCYWFLRRTPCLPWGCYWSSRWDFWEQGSSVSLPTLPSQHKTGIQ